MIGWVVCSPERDGPSGVPCDPWWGRWGGGAGWIKVSGHQQEADEGRRGGGWGRAGTDCHGNLNPSSGISKRKQHQQREGGKRGRTRTFPLVWRAERMSRPSCVLWELDGRDGTGGKSGNTQASVAVGVRCDCSGSSRLIQRWMNGGSVQAS